MNDDEALSSAIASAGKAMPGSSARACEYMSFGLPIQELAFWASVMAFVMRSTYLSATPAARVQSSTILRREGLPGESRFMSSACCFRYSCVVCSAVERPGSWKPHERSTTDETYSPATLRSDRPSQTPAAALSKSSPEESATSLILTSTTCWPGLASTVFCHFIFPPSLVQLSRCWPGVTFTRRSSCAFKVATVSPSTASAQAKSGERSSTGAAACGGWAWAGPAGFSVFS